MKERGKGNTQNYLLNKQKWVLKTYLIKIFNSLEIRFPFTSLHQPEIQNNATHFH